MVIHIINTITAVLFLVASIGFVYWAVKLWKLFKAINDLTNEHFFQIRKKTVQLDELIKRHEERALEDIARRISLQVKPISQADKYTARR